jgi:hypothetical protein
MTGTKKKQSTQREEKSVEIQSWEKENLVVFQSWFLFFH